MDEIEKRKPTSSELKKIPSLNAELEYWFIKLPSSNNPIPFSQDFTDEEVKSFALEMRMRDMHGRGVSDDKILENIFQEYSKNGLTQSEFGQIARFDDLLKNAEIVFSSKDNTATINVIQGNTFKANPVQWTR